MKKLVISSLFLVLTNSAFSAEFSSCSDKEYINYVDKRNEFYSAQDRQSYKESIADLQGKPIESLPEKERILFLFSNTISSARFDSVDVANKTIELYQEEIPAKLFKPENEDAKHRVQIALGWLALNAGDEKKAISHLLESTNVKSTPVLGSFGPDRTLIRELYDRGHKAAVLDYLDRVQTFWNSASALEDLRIWKIMIENNCPIQFAFYDTTSFEKLGLQ